MSQFISLQDAVDLTTQHRSYKETILATVYRNQNVLPVCETFDRNTLDRLLAQTDCQKIRIYLSMDTNYKVKIVVVGVDSNDEDLLTRDSEVIGEEARRCPDDCPPSSPLNS